VTSQANCASLYGVGLPFCRLDVPAERESRTAVVDARGAIIRVGEKYLSTRSAFEQSYCRDIMEKSSTQKCCVCMETLIRETHMNSTDGRIYR